MIKRVTFAVPMAVAAIGLAACSVDAPQPHPSSTTTTVVRQAPNPTTSSTAPPVTTTPTLRAKTVPADLVGQTLAIVKARLAKLGFTHVVVAGGEITDADTVAAVPKAGKRVALGAKLVVIGKPSAPPASERDTPGSGSAGSTADRTPPTAGYQCRPGDEKLYTVCAGHKAWVDGQVEYARCIESGGKWDVPSQSCVRKDG